MLNLVHPKHLPEEPSNRLASCRFVLDEADKRLTTTIGRLKDRYDSSFHYCSGLQAVHDQLLAVQAEIALVEQRLST